MTRKRFVGAITLGVPLIGLLMFAGEGFYKSSPSQRVGYSTDLSDLRDKFNRDKGKVRLLLLLSPT